MEKILKFKTLSLVLAALPLSVSCEYTFDLKGLGTEGKVYLTCVAGSSDTTVFDLATTLPIKDIPGSPVPTDNARASLSVNGTPVELSRSTDSSSGIPEGSFYILRRFSPGDVLDFSASVEGLDAVSASTVIPEKFPEVATEVSLDSAYNSSGNPYKTVTFTVSFDDDPGSEDYYGISVRRLTYYEKLFDQTQETFDNEDYEGWMTLVYDTADETTSRDPVLTTYYSGGNGIGDQYGGEMILWDDGPFNGKRASLEVSVVYDQDERYTMKTGVLNCRYKYRLVLYRLSPEFYRKVKSEYIISNNSYISQGLVSPSFIYTNVNGGLGLFGSLSVSRSPWLGNPGGLADAGPYE